MFRTLKMYFEFANKENRKKLLSAMVLGVLKAMFAMLKIPAIAVIIQGILDNNMTRNAIWTSFGIMCLSIIGQVLVGLKTTMLQTEAGYNTCSGKRIEIAEHLRYLPMGFFNTNSLGQITNITTNTMEQFADVATLVVMITSQGIITTAVIFVFLAFFDIRIALILLAGILIFSFFNTLMQKATIPVAPRTAKAGENLVSAVIEYIQGIAEVKNFNLTQKSAKKLESTIKEKQAADTKMEFTVIPYMFLQGLSTKLTGVIMCLLSIYFYFTGSMPLLYTIIMTISSFMIYESLDMMGGFSALMRNVNIIVDKANDVLSLTPMDIDGEDITPSKMDIELKNVSFAYEDKTIIDNVSLKIPEKTTTAIVGPSGGGKTTLTNLMARFWDVGSGEVFLGGKNVKEYSFDSLMKNFSFVFQRVYLFEDTIANNIRFGEPEASMDKVIKAAKKARCHDFIMSLPEGYDTKIGEGGASLSGGEKQRISIARAIMKNAPIIILDEATANVDPENEAELTRAIEELTKDKTIIMIAHRLKTVRNANQILVVSDGKIVQKGTHDELMAKEGIYKNFVSERKEAVSWKIA
ncbi:ATP-binding cassette, subfamily B [Acetitomaculum ruminis DSM 5522]|uniref:ATP-binding cassette, subfamily B n=1 Tax=Acetitomaculum ruminis DSM 5522 TaxID=1120918 RepID=A0A1I1A3X5_9FIRM|nr:ABC transporter ATP-binding protein [Acetitomaculum ruminis]SFB32056.1 ATP-binding cassette, subfamily B [Acetitomaculum ruminis DSM 5522]